jgi:hypothetical protein
MHDWMDEQHMGRLLCSVPMPLLLVESRQQCAVLLLRRRPSLPWMARCLLSCMLGLHSYDCQVCYLLSSVCSQGVWHDTCCSCTSLPQGVLLPLSFPCCCPCDRQHVVAARCRRLAVCLVRSSVQMAAAYYSQLSHWLCSLLCLHTLFLF